MSSTVLDATLSSVNNDLSKSAALIVGDAEESIFFIMRAQRRFGVYCTLGRFKEVIGSSAGAKELVNLQCTDSEAARNCT